MNNFSAAKLRHSKWTAVHPRNREKHFLVTDLIRDEHEHVEKCIIEAVYSHREAVIDWRELQNSERWIQGWK